jgi:hypothetical protein
MLRAEDITMDYPQFALDLYNFQFPGGGDAVRLRWGEGFYREINRQEQDQESGKDDN